MGYPDSAGQFPARRHARRARAGASMGLGRSSAVPAVAGLDSYCPMGHIFRTMVRSLVGHGEVVVVVFGLGRSGHDVAVGIDQAIAEELGVRGQLAEQSGYRGHSLALLA